MVSQAYKLRKYACGGVWFLFSFDYNKTLTSQAFLGVSQNILWRFVACKKWSDAKQATTS